MIRIVTRCGRCVVEYLHFLIAWTKLSVQCKESLSAEVPLACGEELQNIQTITDTSLHATHATRKNNLWFQSIKFQIGIGNECMYLQSWLAKAEHKKINNVGRHPLVEEQSQRVNEFICGHVTAWIPYTCFKWILIVQFFAKVKHFAPCNLLAVRTGHIEHRNVSWSVKINLFFEICFCFWNFVFSVRSNSYVRNFYSLFNGCANFVGDRN